MSLPLNPEERPDTEPSPGHVGWGSTRSLADCYYVRAAVLHLIAARGSSTLGGSSNTALLTAARLSVIMEEAGIDHRQWVHELYELERVGLVMYVEPEDVPEHKAAWALTSLGSSAVCQQAGTLQYFCELLDDEEAA